MKPLSLLSYLPRLDTRTWLVRGVGCWCWVCWAHYFRPCNKIAWLSLGYFVELDLRLMCVVHLPLLPLLDKVSSMNS